jgi:hypothetical protein
MIQKNEGSDQSSSKPYPFQLKSLLIWTAVLVLGFIFRGLEWAYDDILIVLATAGISAYTFHHFIRSKDKDVIKIAVLSLAAIWLIVFIWGAFFNNGYPFNKTGLKFYFYFFLIVMGIYEIVRFVKFRKK